MYKFCFLLLLLFLSLPGKSQRVPLSAIVEKLKQGKSVSASDFGFQEYSIIDEGDTILFYTYSKPGTNPASIYLELPGTNAEDVYTYHKEKNGNYWFNSLTSFDFSFLPDDFLFVIVAKPGFGFVSNGDSLVVPSKYWEKTSLQDRVQRADRALKFVSKKLIKKPKQVVVFGYSEGFYVGAKLAAVNKQITHLGIGGGGGFIDFYDFILFNQRSLCEEKANPDSVIKSNESLISSLSEMVQNPSSTEFNGGYTYKRWASFAEPPLNSLVKLNIPIYQVHGSLDESTAIENAYLVPLEFARLGKKNLNFKVYPNSDHSLIERHGEGKETNHWNEMIKEFFQWVQIKAKSNR